MAIEVTSICPEANRLSLRRGLAFVRNHLPETPLTNSQLFARLVCTLIAFAIVAGSDALLSSYKHYSRIIDARLAGGYQISRPGIYAAPRTIAWGQKITQAELVAMLRHAGYLEAARATPWNGSFSEMGSAVSIRPATAQANKPLVVKVTFRDHEIETLTGDEIPLRSYVLQPEPITNDVSAKFAARHNLTYDEIPPVLAHAILAIEDQRFFAHRGVDVFGIARALWRNASEDRAGQGGSTITQQLVKNTYLTSEKTFARKYAEAMLALALERRLSKQDIFALYCNEIYLGQRGAVAVRGVAEAAHIYFGKELNQLTLAEAATIAGMIQSPARYSPVHLSEAAQARKQMVLDAMLRAGWISSTEASAASLATVALAPSDNSGSVAPHFIDYVNRLTSDGNQTRVYTTLDLDLQRLAEKALHRQLDHLAAVYPQRAVKPQGALVALDPRTGNVLAMVGGRDYATSQLNRATDARRQPGSTFKPFVYAAALEDGMSPMQMFSDAPRDFIYDRKRVYRPANFGGGYSMRDVTMRTALVNSLNVVSVEVAMQTGLARIANLAADFGLPRPERFPSLALGTGEVTPLELAAAYAVFANGGRRVVPRVIESVGEPPATHSGEKNSKQVISPTTAYMITNMLEAVVDHGTARAARGTLPGSAFAAKTGTSRDGWFVGYTPNLVCVVWIGFDDNQQLGLTGAEAALPAWVQFMHGAIALDHEFGGRNFECPEGIKFIEIDADSGLLSTLTCPHRELIAVTDRLAPNLECYRHGNLSPGIDGPTGTETEVERPSPLLTHHPANSAKQAQRLATRVILDHQGHSALVTEMR